MIDQKDLDSARAKVLAAAESFERAKSQYLTFDGKPVLAPAEHEEALANLRGPVDAAAERAIEIADQASAQVAKERLLPAACPTNRLSAAELETAGALAVFVREDCAELPPAALAERLEWVRASGTKAQQWVYARYAERRWQREQAAKPPAPGMDLLGAELRAIAEPKQGLSAESRRLAEQAAALKRFARAQLAGDSGRPGTGRPMGI
jgi:hypothetical protein